ncbi:MAG TPA: aquaporin [Gemmatimonadaceae bacterium]|nr:aquaporin [Gemmatimonadaceae bacterium]
MSSTYVRHAYSEFLGTFALTFVGSAAIMLKEASGGSLLEVALAHGLVLSIMVTAFMHIAAHFNPAVTIAFVFTRRIPLSMAGLHIAMQFAGAIVAAFLLKALFPAALFSAAHGGGQAISVDIGGAQAWVLEALATFFLMTAIFGTAVNKKAPNVGGFAIGLTVAFDILAIGPFTGASMNPARTFGPAMAYGVYEGVGIYITAPIVGAIIAALAYDNLILKEDPAAPTA